MGSLADEIDADWYEYERRCRALCLRPKARWANGRLNPEWAEHLETLRDYERQHQRMLEQKE